MLSLMNSPSRISLIVALVLMATLFAGCGQVTPVPVGTATTVPNFTPAILTATELPLVSSSTSTLTPSLPVSSAPDGLRMAYIIDGNLYFQESSKSPVQLTDKGDDWNVLFFSEDGERVFFFRDAIRHDLYSINVDGTQEQALVTKDLLAAFGSDYDKSTTPCEPVLVPHTHFLIFRTCSHPDELTTIYNSDLFIADTNANQVKNLFPREQGGTFYVSPNGSMLALDRLGHIDILSIDGKVVHSKVITYAISEPVPLSPYVYWTSDSKELVAALPINTFYDTSQSPTYAIWRYSLDTGEKMHISLNPPPMSNEPMWVSPYGDWITYNNRDEQSFYLGNLREGGALPYEIALPYAWSQDNVHFLYAVPQSGGSDLYLAAVNGSSVYVGKGEFMSWLNASRYIFFVNQTFIMGEIDGKPLPILAGNTQHLYSNANIIFTYQP